MGRLGKIFSASLNFFGAENGIEGSVRQCHAEQNEA